jgi:uroporphyrinogen-III synthase
MKKLPFTRVVITRPKVQNQKLNNRLTKVFLEQGVALPIIALPLLEIVPIDSQELASALHLALDQTEWVSFVSPNAFLMCDQLLKKFGWTWPKHLSIAVVGGGSEQSILDSGIEYAQIIKPQDTGSWDSEGLWEALLVAQPEWTNRRMVMIHGEGGRNFLSEHLKDAGAVIEEFAVYRRQGLSKEDIAWKSIDPTEHGIWVFNSSQAGDVLIKRLRELEIVEQFLQHETAIVSHPRILEKIQEIGFGEVLMIEPGDDQLIKTMLHIFKRPL